MRGIDLSKFKKTAEDDKSTTLKHPDGHSMVIAVGSLTPKLRAELKKLPMIPELKKGLEKLPPEPGYTEKEPKKFAGGGDTDLDTPENTPGSSGLSQEQFNKLMINQPAQQQSSQTQQSSPQDMDQNSPAQISEEEDETPEEAPTTQPDASSATTPQQTPIQQQAPLTPEQHGSTVSQEIMGEDQGLKNDFAMGHITPETYSSMFAKKDTLGKIGTIFGMILSGAGSGLAHQPNMLMQLMQQELNNDLDAQKTSAANAQNFYRLQQAHQIQQAQIKQMGFQNQLVQAQKAAIEAKTPAEVAEANARITQMQAQAKQANADAAIKADALAKIVANRATVQHLMDIVNNTSTTPQARAQAQQTLAMIANSVDNDSYDIASRAAAKSAFYNLILNNGQGTQPQPPTSQPLQPPVPQPQPSQQPQASTEDPEDKFKRQVQMLKVTGNDKYAEDLISKHMPGVPGQASVPLSADDRDRIQSAQALTGSLKRLQDFANKNADSVDPRIINEGKALAAQVQGDFRMATRGGVYKEGEQNFIGQIIPGDPTKFLPSVTILPKIQAVLNETGARNNQFLQSKGFPVQQNQTPMQSQQPQYKTVNGVKYMRGPNGEAIKVK